MDQATVIRFYRRNVYGNESMYAVDHAAEISQLTSRKTLLKNDFEALKGLGFTFKEVLPPVVGK